MDFGGSHTSAIQGGEAVEYQGRKKSKSTNALYLSDRQGLPLAISVPVAGNHNDLEVQFEVVTGTLEQVNIPVEGLFLNADAGFDSKEFRMCCEKKEMEIQIEMNILTNYFIKRDIKLKGQMLGSTALDHCLIDLTHQLQVG